MLWVLLAAKMMWFRSEALQKTSVLNRLGGFLYFTTYVWLRREQGNNRFCMVGKKNREEFMEQLISVSLMWKLLSKKQRWDQITDREKRLSVISSGERSMSVLCDSEDVVLGFLLVLKWDWLDCSSCSSWKIFLWCGHILPAWLTVTLHSRVCLSALTFWLLIFGVVTQS